LRTFSDLFWGRLLRWGSVCKLGYSTGSTFRNRGFPLNRYACWIGAVLVSLTCGFSQTADHKHELVPFAAPPSGQTIWNLARSVAVDGKGSIIIYRGSEPSVLIYNRAGQLQK